MLLRQQVGLPMSIYAIHFGLAALALLVLLLVAHLVRAGTVRHQQDGTSGPGSQPGRSGKGRIYGRR
jgi:hypothetical protein